MARQDMPSVRIHREDYDKLKCLSESYGCDIVYLVHKGVEKISKELGE